MCDTVQSMLSLPLVEHACVPTPIFPARKFCSDVILEVWMIKVICSFVSLEDTICNSLRTLISSKTSVWRYISFMPLLYISLSWDKTLGSHLEGSKFARLCVHL